MQCGLLFFKFIKIFLGSILLLVKSRTIFLSSSFNLPARMWKDHHPHTISLRTKWENKRRNYSYHVGKSLSKQAGLKLMN